MSSEADPRDARPHAPKLDIPVAREGFERRGGERDVFFAAVEKTRMPMAVADPRLPDAPLVFANQAFLEMTGYQLAEVRGKNCRFLQGPETDRATVDLIRDAILTASEVTVELLNYRKDGSAFWNALFLTPIFDESGDLIYFFSSQMDVTRRHDAEEGLRQAQRLEALGQISGAMAHDFNNLLQVIMGSAEVARMRTNALGVHDDLLSKSLTKISDVALKSAALTHQLLSYARKQELRGRLVSVAEVVDKVKLLSEGLLHDGTVLRSECARADWVIRVDPVHLESALINLVVNARDAISGQGEVVISCAHEEFDAERALSMSLPAPGRYAQICVRDNGSGIPAAILPRVVDPFFTTKAERGGTGLGLSTVWGFAKQSRGAARIESTVGQGTAVSLFFPAVATSGHQALAPAPVTAASSGLALLKGKHALVVDDRIEVAEMAAAMLTGYGMRCVIAGSASEALDELEKQESCELLVTDLIMPGDINGVVLAQRAMEKKAFLAVLLMTGFADGSLDRWGGDGFELVIKPFSSLELGRAAVRALSQNDGSTRTQTSTVGRAVPE